MGTGETRLLVDTGEGKLEFANLLRQTLQTHSIKHIKDIIITHRHHDHIGGISQILDICNEVLSSSSSSSSLIPRVWKHLPNPTEKSHQHDPRFHYENIVDGQVFKVEGATLKAVYTPGHSDDHVNGLCGFESIDKAD